MVLCCCWQKGPQYKCSTTKNGKRCEQMAIPYFLQVHYKDSNWTRFNDYKKFESIPPFVRTSLVLVKLLMMIVVLNSPWIVKICFKLVKASKCFVTFKELSHICLNSTFISSKFQAIPLTHFPNFLCGVCHMPPSKVSIMKISTFMNYPHER